MAVPSRFPLCLSYISCIFLNFINLPDLTETQHLMNWQGNSDSSFSLVRGVASKAVQSVCVVNRKVSGSIMDIYDNRERVFFVCVFI